MTERFIFHYPAYSTHGACINWEYMKQDRITSRPYVYDLLEYTGEIAGAPVFKIVKERVDITAMLKWLGADIVAYDTAGIMICAKKGEKSE